MRKTLLACIAAALLLLQVSTRAEDLAYARFGEYLEALRLQTGIPGMVVAVVGRSAVQWERSFGVADIEKNIPTRIDTPFHLDGLSETFTASLVLRCVEQGDLTLDDRIGKFAPDSEDAGLTIRQVLSHTTGTPENTVYQFRPERFEALSVAIQECTDLTYRQTLSRLFTQLGMYDSVAGPDIVSTLLPTTDQAVLVDAQRYTAVLSRLAVPYIVDLPGKKITLGQYGAQILNTISGAVSTVQDLEKFDLALKDGVVLTPETIAIGQTAPVNAVGQRLPHGLGWFSQNYMGENIYWQFGAADSGGSALIITWPSRGLTFIALANSNGLVRPYNLEKGDVRTSPFAKLFLSLFIR